jgi:benzoylformate decarboxylase
VVGDGSFLFCPQALWTARREGLPVVTVVLNNRGYLILRRFVAEMRGTTATDTTGYVGLDIDHPDVDLLSIAQGFGVAGVRIGSPADIGDAVREAFAAGRPSVIELTVGAPDLG